MYARPRAGIQTVIKPRAQLGRRICHKCEHDIQPATRNECQSCGHLKCSQCPRLPQKSRRHGKSAQHGEEQCVDEEVPMVKAVQRVHRKPRQRVRYTCEHCDSLFVERSRCLGCGHERCTNCHREPPKRAPIRHDPEILRAVADRLAAYGATLQHSPGVTVGGA
ncbi:uncharacterized protein MYCFIDRAFT_212397 [Pseudocercospora fijiensis CIRAD86]|uniref:Uncharacterized protein n=1 Tax=Pseudocercospora fijiensis (strain CIRAD86) TaxID=383855 RepID=M3ALZ2_PSEFD|nr:uncharacterized protein MYCFIDRAFT_212397 [Pseudocercospora fijiensis CIRAD86]EME78487.1 hypothetical protein MYCFIDRAFT_212397 [Pseudocercospora fijiensis CIRAD86]